MRALLAALALLLAAGASAAAGAGVNTDSLFDTGLTLTDIEGRPWTIGQFRGRVLLVVNVASECGFTDANYRGLVDLHTRYGSQGLDVLAFPCNQFGGQEPGSPNVIQAFARERYQARFHLFAKVDVNGPAADPLFSWLKAHAPGGDSGDLGWNFVKFLVGRDGRVLKRYGWDFSGAEIERDVAAALALAGGDAGEL